MREQNPREQFGKKLLELRNEAGLDRRSVGKQLQLLNQTIYYWEIGKNLPTAQQLETLAKLYRVPFETLLEELKGIVTSEANIKISMITKLNQSAHGTREVRLGKILGAPPKSLE